MPADAVVFAARAEPGALEVVGDRTRLVERLYAALGPCALVVRRHEESGSIAGVVAPGAEAPDPTGPLAFGGEVPRDLEPAAATALQLRSLPPGLGVLDLDASGPVAVVSAGGQATLYEARGDGVVAWSSHAVAAALLAGGSARVAAASVPEHVACEFTGGGRTLIDGVRALGPATRVRCGLGDPREETFWAPRERWVAPLDGREALDEELDRAVGRAAGAVVGLTAGLDSRAVAARLVALGTPLSAFSHRLEADDAADSQGGAAAARALGIEHETAPIELWDDAHGLERVRSQALWTDGQGPTGYGEVRRWPDGMSHWITGVGGETGRAFYWRWSLRSEAAHDPSPEHLVRVLSGYFEPGLFGLDAERRRVLRARFAEWVGQAEPSGLRGHALLDVLYAEQRVRHWGRATAPRTSAHLVAGLGGQRTLAALAGLSLGQKLTSGFQRDVIADAGLDPGSAPAAPRGAVPPLLKARALMSLRALRRAARLPPLRAPSDPWFSRPPWEERPAFAEWLADGVLASPFLAEAMGEGWCREVRAAFLRGNGHAAHLALVAGGPVALRESLREIGAPVSSP